MVSRHDFQQFLGICFDRKCSNHATDLDKHELCGRLRHKPGSGLRREPMPAITTVITRAAV